MSFDLTPKVPIWPKSLSKMVFDGMGGAFSFYELLDFNSSIVNSFKLRAGAIWMNSEYVKRLVEKATIEAGSICVLLFIDLINCPMKGR